MSELLTFLFKLLNVLGKVDNIKTPATITFDGKNIPVNSASTTISWQGIDAVILNTTIDNHKISARHTFRDNGAEDLVSYDGTAIPHATFNVDTPSLATLAWDAFTGGNFTVTYTASFTEGDGTTHTLVIVSSSVVVTKQNIT
jgi:hypothetical protein